MKGLTNHGKAAVAIGLALVLIKWRSAVLNVWTRQGFWLNYEGMEFPDLSEVYYVNYYLAFGIPALALLAYAVTLTSLPDRIAQFGEKVCRWQYSVLILALLSFAGILIIQRTVLLNTVVTDDEYTFQFIADTLLKGRVINPLPAEPQFFQNQFIVLNDYGWFGKYPLGHPILLALGSLVGQRQLVVPLVSVLLLMATYWLGRRLCDARTAFIGAVLLALSPQFLLTAGTELSQPTCALSATLGLIALLRLEDGGGPAEAVACGLAFGYAVFVRPLPGVLFLPVAGVYLLTAVPGNWRRRLGMALIACVPLAVLGLVMLAVNMRSRPDIPS